MRQVQGLEFLSLIRMCCQRPGQKRAADRNSGSGSRKGLKQRQSYPTVSCPKLASPLGPWLEGPMGRSSGGCFTLHRVLCTPSCCAPAAAKVTYSEYTGSSEGTSASVPGRCLASRGSFLSTPMLLPLLSPERKMWHPVLQRNHLPIHKKDCLLS